VQPPRANCPPESDLARALGDRDEQNVHDADAADQQRDRGHRGKKQSHDTAAAFRRFDELAQIAHVEILERAGLDAMATDKSVGHFTDRRLHPRLADRLHIDLICETGQARLQIVWIGRGQTGPIEQRLLLIRRRDTQHFTLGLTKSSDYQWARPALVANKLRSMELQAGQPARKGNKRGAAYAYNIKELRDREIELARHAEQAYERFVSQWRQRGNSTRRTGAASEERR